VLEQVRRNLALRMRMLEEFGAIDAPELAKLAGSKARNVASTVDNWRRADRIAPVRWRGRTLVPGFQLLETGQPDPVIRPVIQVLRSCGMGDWEQALWFVIPNPTLGGRRPVDVLLGARREPRGDCSDRLVTAAQRRRDWP